MSGADPAPAVPEPAGDDQVRPFQVDDQALGGRVSRLSRTVDSILRQHDYPTPVATLLGEALTLASLLAGRLKSDGVLTVQSSGDGPVRTLVADITSAGGMRGYARFDADAVGDRTGRALVGKGHLAFTLDQGTLDQGTLDQGTADQGTADQGSPDQGSPDQGRADRYQGIVEWSGDTLAECVRHYFAQSEQVHSDLRLSVGRVETPGGGPAWRAGGILIQRLPRGDAATDGNVIAADLDATGWEAARSTVASLEDWDLLDPLRDQDDLLRHLFTGHPVRVFDPIPVSPTCRCSRERVEVVLRSLSADEINTLKLKDDRIEATCEFCSTRYRFTPRDLAALQQPGG